MENITKNTDILIKDNKLNMPVLINKVNDTIITYCTDNNIDTDKINKLNQIEFNALLMYIGYTVFIPGNILKRDNKAYDIDRVYECINIYILLCNKYNKVFTVHGFLYMTGINYNTYMSWCSGKSNVTGATYNLSQLIKTLDKLNELSLSDKLLTYNNPVGGITILNHSHNWSQQEQIKTKQVETLSLEDIRKQVGIGTSDLSKLSDSSSADDA